MSQTSDNQQASTAFGAQGWPQYQEQVPQGPPPYWPYPQQPGNWGQPAGMPQPYPYPPGQPYPYPTPPAVPLTTNGTAIFAFIMSLLWIGGLGSLLGLIFGIMGAKECDRTGQAGHGLATAAAIIGVVGLFFSLIAFS